MTQEEIIEGNKLIAVFIGLKEKGFGRNMHFVDKNGKIIAMSYLLQYHTSWDWLMPVVEKIESLGLEILDECNLWYFQINKQEVFINMSGILNNGNKFELNKYIESETKKEAIYKAVVEFIKWFNQQNTQQ